MIVIVPDTNVLSSSPKLSSPPWQSLLEHRVDWDVKVLVPDVVLMETVNVVRRTWRAELDKLDKLQVGEFGVDEQLRLVRETITARIENYEHELRDRLDTMGAEILELPAVDHLEIARRASLRLAPYTGDTKDGYRDTLIWLTVVAAAKDHGTDEIWFVSENTRDFGPKAPHWTGQNQGNQQDCPILFHSHLLGELKDQQLDDRVKLVTRLQNLEQHIAAQYAPIDAERLSQLVDALDFASLNKLLELTPKGTEVIPSEAALDPIVAKAHTQQLKVQNAAAWKFADAAKRGEGRWTAQFSVNVDAEIMTYDIVGSGHMSVVTKPLSFSGLITVKEQTEVEELIPTSLTSLPDDPDRALWENNGLTQQEYRFSVRSLRAISEMLKDAESGTSIAEMLETTGSISMGQSIADMVKNANAGSSVSSLLAATGAGDFGTSLAEMAKGANASSSLSAMLATAGSLQTELSTSKSKHSDSSNCRPTRPAEQGAEPDKSDG